GLPTKKWRMGITGGAAAAVVLRVVLTFLAGKLLHTPYIQLAGGLLILWIAVKVLRDCSESPEAMPAPGRFAQAIRYIVVADVTMSTDNILAIAGASQGHIGLIVF